MKCSKCGMILKDDLLFCPLCKNKMQESNVSVSEFRDVEDFRVTSPYVEENNCYLESDGCEELSVYRKTEKKSSSSSTWLTVLIAVALGLIVTIAAAIIIIGLYTGEGEKADVKYICETCSAEMNEDVKNCDECIKNYSCKICNAVSKKVENDFCPDCVVEYTCIHCDKVDESVKEGYCKECAEELACKSSDCDTIVEKGYYCDECIDSLVGDKLANGCRLCKSTLKNDEIFLIDTYGNPYCLGCDTGKYCSSCNGYIEILGNDDVCIDCAEYSCFSCKDVLEKSEIKVTDKNGNHYCSSCDTSYYCSYCGAPVNSRRSKCKACGR